MSEEIIINGVDVSDCMFYGNDECDYGYMKYNSTFKDKMGYPKKCKENSICYYKQLKCLQEENEKLKEILSQQQELDNEIEALSNEDKYKQALEEIKEKLEIYKKIRDNASIFTSEFTLASGAVTALKWVLEDNKDENS